MTIPMSEFKKNPSKYFEDAKTCDVIVTLRGQRVGRIVCEEKAAKSDRQRAFERFMDMSSAPSVPDPTIYDPIKEERLRERGLL